MNMAVRYFLLVNGRRLEVIPLNQDAMIGLGEEEGGTVYLMPYEALYLLEKGHAKVRDNGSEVSFQELFATLSETGFNSSVYLVYRDLRERGYFIRKGIEPHYQLSVAKGKDEPSTSKVIVLREGEFLRAARLLNSVKAIIREEREPLIAIVDRRGEITYYRTFIFHGEQ